MTRSSVNAGEGMAGLWKPLSGRVRKGWWCLAGLGGWGHAHVAPISFYWTDIKLTTVMSRDVEPGLSVPAQVSRSAVRSNKSLQPHLKKSCHFTRNKLS